MKDLLKPEQRLRLEALNLAVNLGLPSLHDPDTVLSNAKKFEDYIKSGKADDKTTRQ